MTLESCPKLPINLLFKANGYCYLRTMSVHTLSIIVVTYNESQHVARLQRSIKNMDKPDGVHVETILVDGGSQDGTPEAARRAGIKRVIELPGANIPVCRNRGAEAAQGDWMAYVDGDCELAKDWLTTAYPLLTGCEAVMLGWPARPPDPMNAMQAAWNFHWLNKNPRLEDFMGRRVVRHEGFRLATTRNMILHKSVFSTVQGFNEDLPTGEDTDFAFRAYMANITVLGVPDLKVVHHGEPVTLRQFYKQQVWHANRRSYEHIQKLSGGKIGGNAPRFAKAFMAGLLCGVVGLAISAVTGNAWWLLLLLPVLGVIGIPAAYISLKGRSLRHLPMLCLLYGTYGWARMQDWVGLAQSKASWKS